MIHSCLFDYLFIYADFLTSRSSPMAFEYPEILTYNPEPANKCILKVNNKKKTEKSMNKIKLAPFPSVSIAELEQLNAGCGEG